MRQHSYPDTNTSTHRLTIARREAIKVFSFVNKNFAPTLASLQALSKGLSNPDVKSLLLSPNSNDEERAEALYAQTVVAMTTEAKAVVDALLSTGHLAVLPETINHLKTFHNELEDILTVRVVSNPVVPEHDQQGIEAHLKYLLKNRYSFKKLDFEFILDKSMIKTESKFFGMKIMVGDDCFDLSLENELSKLEIIDTTGNFDFEVKMKKATI